MTALGPIKYLTIHCAATPEGRDVKAATISKWDKAKFGQTSYHHVVEIDGNSVRTLADATKGAHTGGANTGNIGICYVGGLSKDSKAAKDTRTPEQKKALKHLIESYRTAYPNIIVRGHRDWSPDKDRDGVVEPNEWLKQCPSFDVGAWVKAGMPL